MRSSEPSLHVLEQRSVNPPPGTRRTCSSMQLAVVRRARDGEAAAPAALEQHIEILPRLEPQRLDRRQPQEHLHHIRRQPRQAARSGTAAS